MESSPGIRAGFLSTGTGDRSLRAGIGMLLKPGSGLTSLQCPRLCPVTAPVIPDHSIHALGHLKRRGLGVVVVVHYQRGDLLEMGATRGP